MNIRLTSQELCLRVLDINLIGAKICVEMRVIMRKEKLIKTLKHNCKKNFATLVAAAVIMSSATVVYPFDAEIVSAANKKASVVKAGKASITTTNGKAVVSKKSRIVTITKNGTYTLSGNFGAYRIIMNKRSMNVTLRLNGVTMSNSKTACIYNTKKSANLSIQLVKGTRNILMGPMAFPEVTGKTGSKKVSPDAVVMSDGNLKISGSGRLNVKDTSSNGNAIDSKKDINISAGDIFIVSKKYGIHADNVNIGGGDISVTSSDTGIKASQKVVINGGSVLVDAIDKGIQGRTGVIVKKGSISVKTRKNPGTKYEDFRGIAAGRSGKNGKTAVFANVDISGGKININSYGDCIHASANVNITDGTLSLTSTAEHGIRAKQTLSVKSSVKISISSKKKKVKAAKQEIASNIKL